MPTNEWSVLLGGVRCSDPYELNNSMAMSNYAFRDELDCWQRASSYECPRGKDTGKAYVILNRGDFNNLRGANSGSGSAGGNSGGPADKFDLTFNNPMETVVVVGLTITNAFSMFGMAQDNSSPMLVELRDVRDQFKFSAAGKIYNVVMPCPSPGSSNGIYYPESLNGSSPWAYQDIINDLWNLLPNGGSTPFMPLYGGNIPEDFRFLGVNAWEAIHVVLAQVGQTTAYNPFDGTFSIVRLGDAQAGLADSNGNAGSLSGMINRLMQDYDPPDNFTAGNMPATVRVNFPRHEVWRGVEKDTAINGNWESLCVHFEDVPTGFTNGVGTLPVWGDLWAYCLPTGDKVLANQSALQNRAMAIAADIIQNTPKRLRKVYSGATSAFILGSQISLLTIRDYGDYSKDLGQITIIEHNRPSPFVQRDIGGMLIEGETLEPIDIARKSHPVYPDLMQVVQIIGDSPSSQTGDNVNSQAGILPNATNNAVNLFAANVMLIRNGLMTQDPCYATMLMAGTDLIQQQTGTVNQLYHGRLSGTALLNGIELPLYSIENSSEQSLKGVFIELTTKMPLGGFAKAKKLVWNGAQYAVVGNEFYVKDFTQDVGREPGSFIAAPGYRGWAKIPNGDDGALDPDGNVVYPLVIIEHVAEMIQGVLTEDMNRMTGVSNNADVIRFWNGKDPGEEQNVYDRMGLFRTAKKGAEFTARRNDKIGDGEPAAANIPSGSYELIECDSLAGAIYFKTTEDRSPGSPLEPIQVLNNAVLGDSTNLFWIGTQQDIQQPPLGTFQVWYRSGYFPYMKSGAKGIAVLDTDDERYYVVISDQMSMTHSGYLTNPMCGTDNAVINNANPQDFFPFSQAVNITSAVNNLDLAGGINDYVIIKWDETIQDWYVLQVQHHLRQPIVGIRSNQGSCTIEQQTQNVWVMVCGGPNGWETAISLFSTPLPVDVQLAQGASGSGSGSSSDPASCSIQANMQYLCTLNDISLNTPNWVDKVVFNKITAINNIYQDGININAQFIDVFVPCSPTLWTGTVLTLEDCASSGSGSSGG